MMNSKVKVTVGAKSRTVAIGTTVGAVLADMPAREGVTWLGALVNNRLVGLNSELRGNATVVPVDYRSKPGAAKRFLFFTFPANTCSKALRA